MLMGQLVSLLCTLTPTAIFPMIFALLFCRMTKHPRFKIFFLFLSLHSNTRLGMSTVLYEEVNSNRLYLRKVRWFSGKIMESVHLAREYGENRSVVFVGLFSPSGHAQKQY